MSNEIKISVSLEFENSVGSDLMAFSKLLFDMSGTDYQHGTQSIDTGEEAIVIGDVAAGGYIIIKNHDTTNYVSIHKTGVAAVVKLNAGDIAMFRTEIAPFATADTAACIIEYLILDA